MTSDVPIERIETLHLEPGDVLVVRLPDGPRISNEDLGKYRANLQKHLGDVPIIFAQGEISFTPVKAVNHV